MQYYRRAEAKFKVLRDTNEVAGMLVNISTVYKHLSDTVKIKKLYKRALELFKQTDCYKGQGLILLNLGSNSQNKEELRNYSHTAIDIFENKIGKPYSTKLAWYLSTTYSNLASSYQNDSLKIDSAFYYYRKGLNLTIDFQVLNQVSGCLFGLSSLYIAREDYETALLFGLEAYGFARQSNYLVDLNHSSKNLYDIYKKRGKNDVALKYFELHRSYSDSLKGVEEETQLLIAEYQAELDHYKAEEYTRSIKEKILLILLMLLFILPVSYWMYTKYKALNKERTLLIEEIQQLKNQKTLTNIIASDIKIKNRKH